MSGYELKIQELGGRFQEEINVEYYIGYGSSWSRLLALKLFKGRPPFYRRWIEVFLVMPRIELSGRVIVFLGSDLERNFIDCLSQKVLPAEKLFIEYLYDAETTKALELGVPPHLTRLGFMLFENGFTWFKNLYYPEGFMEGGPKLQAEKPISEEAKIKQLKERCSEALDFVETIEKYLEEGSYRDVLVKAYLRAKALLNGICLGLL